VRHHHEKWDGSGYPAGLAGEEIPLGARVLALADALSAIASDRPYRSSRRSTELKAEIIRSSGEHFDPQVVAAFLALMETHGDDFIKNSAETVEKTVILHSINKISPGARYLKKGMLVEDR
jgi:HD-GYP domain-containing protein (c-di-GMP phosphodiesterase class II)